MGDRSPAPYESPRGREMPSMFGKDKKKAALLADLPAQFRTVCRTKNLPPGDFPEIAKFKSVVQELDFAEVQLPIVVGPPVGRQPKRPSRRRRLAVVVPRRRRLAPSSTRAVVVSRCRCRVSPRAARSVHGTVLGGAFPRSPRPLTRARRSLSRPPCHAARAPNAASPPSPRRHRSARFRRAITIITSMIIMI